MQAKSFIDILAHELRKEIRAEVEAELAAARMSPAQRVETSHKADQVHLWLNLKMGGAFVASSARPASAYGKPVRKPSVIRQIQSAVKQEAPAERRGTATTIEQTVAVEFFRREGSSLGETFSEAELKSEFRKVAMRIHPDRHSGASAEQIKSYSARFQTLVESAEILEATLA